MKKGELGQTEALHISCNYKGHERDCRKDCSSCAISIKTEGDWALANNYLNNAIRLYKRAIAMEPKFADAWNNLANAYGMSRNYGESLTAFEKALAIDPRYGKALLGKAIT